MLSAPCLSPRGQRPLLNNHKVQPSPRGPPVTMTRLNLEATAALLAHRLNCCFPPVFGQATRRTCQPQGQSKREPWMLPQSSPAPPRAKLQGRRARARRRKWTSSYPGAALLGPEGQRLRTHRLASWCVQAEGHLLVPDSYSSAAVYNTRSRLAACSAHDGKTRLRRVRFLTGFVADKGDKVIVDIYLV